MTAEGRLGAEVAVVVLTDPEMLSVGVGTVARSARPEALIMNFSARFQEALMILLSHCDQR
jgi:hypothetical protein